MQCHSLANGFQCDLNSLWSIIKMVHKSLSKFYKVFTRWALNNAVFCQVCYWNHKKSRKICKYRISEWAEFQAWKFLHLQKLAHGKKSLPPPRANFKVKFPYLKPKAHSIPVRVNQVMKGI